MPRANSRSRRTFNRAVPKKCTCNAGWLIVAIILFTLGIYSLVAGFRYQFYGYSESGSILLLYFVGVVLVMAAKISKWKSKGTCQFHACC